MGENLLAESREQYARYALTIWEQTVSAGGIRNPVRVLQTLDVLDEENGTAPILTTWVVCGNLWRCLVLQESRRAEWCFTS